MLSFRIVSIIFCLLILFIEYFMIIKIKINTTAIERRLVVYNAKLIAGEIKVSEEYKKAKDTIVICIINDNVVKRNAYLSLAMLKYEKTEEIRYVNMEYEKEEEYLTDMVKYYIIELPKFKKKKPKVADLLEKWLYVIGGDRKMMEECKKENEEIKEAVEQLTQMSADEYERELYEIRERSRLTYNTEMNEARRKGIEEGKKQDRKEIAKKMKEKGTDITYIIEITGLTEEEIKEL